MAFLVVSVLGRVGVEGVYLEDAAGSRQRETAPTRALSGDKMNAMEMQIKRD
jgi:hypothetical protein